MAYSPDHGHHNMTMNRVNGKTTRFRQAQTKVPPLNFVSGTAT